MSGLPITAPVTGAQVFARDPIAALPTQPAQAAHTAVRTLTTSAVQQATLASEADKAARKVLPTVQEKRSRLIGPPPTFEVNLLQHIKETRLDPDLEPPPGEDPLDEAGDAAFPAPTKPETPYDAYARTSSETTDAREVDLSL